MPYQHGSGRPERRLVLLASVFLPGSVLAPLAHELTNRGAEVTVAHPGVPATPAMALSGYADDLRTEPAPIVVAHSNAGCYVPALAAKGLVSAAVFMDAVVPRPGEAECPTMPATLRDELLGRASDGLLPRWTSWWPPDVMRPVFPDDQTFRRVHAAAPRVPSSYVEGSVPVPERWPGSMPAAYVAFGDTYADELALARSLGWPTSRLDLGHLGMLAAPAQVADALGALIDVLSPA